LALVRSILFLYNLAFIIDGENNKVSPVSDRFDCL